MEEMGVTIDNRNTNIVAEMPISIENVQEMVRKNPSAVPERFIVKNDIDRPNISLVSSGDEIPIIDLSLISDGNEDELKKLDLASSEWGFFQVINHDVEEKVLSGMRDTAAEFFNLPFEEKNKYATNNDLQGYGHGQAFVVSKKKTLDWTDCLMLFTYPLTYRNPKYWPTAPLEFKDAIDAYSAGVHKVGEKLLSAFSVLMGMNKDSLQEMHQGVMNVLRMNYYPTCSMPDEVLGVSPHSDASSLTILMQDVAGLQIRHDGGWVSVNPIQNALVVNIGDALEIWSNGKYKSIEHRAITNTDKARTSFASFITPNTEIEIGPLDQMIDPVDPIKLYKKMKYGDFVMGSFKEKYEGKGHTKTEKFEV